MNSYKVKYNEYKSFIEERLDSFLPDVDERSIILRDAMKYSVDAGGKRLRPVLLLASCEAAGGSCEDAVPFACALEFIHTYSLIHDDHPSMDNDDLRRGKPTNHKVFGDDIAILAGDGLLNSAMDVMLCEIMNERGSEMRERKIKAAYEISKASGVWGMVAGQTADVMMTGSRKEKNPEYADYDKYDRKELLYYIHRNKTGAIIRAAVRAGAVLGGADKGMLSDMTVYAEKTGLVFQIVDDILDVTGDEAATGKKQGMDEELGKLTYPSLFGLEKSYVFAAEHTDEAAAALEKYGKCMDFLIKLALDLKKRIS
jgi:geranylgeranyl diphosphate synthase type II